MKFTTRRLKHNQCFHVLRGLSATKLVCSVFVFVIWLLLRKKKEPQGFLWLTPRSGGFNNQLITIYEAINCARLHRRTVVLPLIYENVRADTSSKGYGPYPFEDYFDISELSKVVRVTTPAELDIAGIPCDTVHFSTSRHFKANARRIPRLLKQQYRQRFQLNLSFVPFFDYPVEYRCVDDSMCRPKDADSLGEYSNYEVSGQGYNIRSSSVLRMIRGAFKPSKTVLAIANMVLESTGSSFNSVHLRRGDFSTKCSELPKICERFGNESIVQSREAVLSKVQAFREPHLPLFVTTTHASECRDMLQRSGLKLFFLEDTDLPAHLEWAKSRTDILSFSAQIVASRAKQFVGNRFSSFSTEINNMRYLRNSSEELLFF